MRIAACLLLMVLGAGAAAQTGVDYDLNDDNLIDVRTANQLRAIRHDLTGVGNAAAGEYQTAFPNAMPGMGCPATCAGYELLNDLNLSSISGNWVPIGGGMDVLNANHFYTAVFEGNGYIISNLWIRVTPGRLSHAGLFGAVGAGGTVRNVGLRNPQISVRRNSSTYVGALVGRNNGTVAACYVQGGSIAGVWGIGGLIGRNNGTLVASYADVAVRAANQSNRRGGNAGGLIGETNDLMIGGAFRPSVVSASYSIGRVTGIENLGGLIGNRSNRIGSRAVVPALVQSSYLDTGRSGQSRCCATNAPNPDETPRTSFQLRTPTAAAGTIYAGWDRLNVDRMDQRNDGNFNDDSPWDFGSGLDYPVLRGVSARFPDGNTTNIRVQRQRQPSVLATFSRRGRGLITEGSTVVYAVELQDGIASAATMNWSVELTGTGTGHAEAADFTGARSGQVVLINTTSAVFRVGIASDGRPERQESFRVRLSALQIPVNLRLDANASVIESAIASHGIDYDADDNNLIEVATTSQLSAIRYDLGGRGLVGVDAGSADYQNAFPLFDEVQTCPDGCEGYELANDLDLSSVSNWTPIGGSGNPLEYYTAVFEGNGYVISKLRIDRSVLNRAALFGALGDAGTIRNVGLRDVFVNVGAGIYTSALVGQNEGTVAACYVVGGSVDGVWGTGALAGANNGTLIASYADVVVQGDATQAGGLVGEAIAGSVVSASYSVGLVTGGTFGRTTLRGGLLGRRNQTDAAVYDVQASYYDRERSRQTSCCGGTAPSLDDETSRTSAELRAPTTAAGTIYAGWDRLNVDRMDQRNDGNFNDDSPWDFGTSFYYPVLRGISARFPAGNTTAIRAQQRSQPLVFVTLSQPDLGVSEEGSDAQYTVTLPNYSADPVTISWAVELTGVGPGHAEAADFSGRGLPAGQVVVVNSASAVFRVAIADDGTSEQVERFRVRLSNLRGPDNLRLSAASSAVVSAIASNGMNYDADGDNLIDVATTSQLAAIRYDLQGRGLRGVDVADALAYERAFPNFDARVTCAGACEGYELLRDLDLSSVGNWIPIGGGVAMAGNEPPADARYQGVFDGGAHTLSNMRIEQRRRDSIYSHVGLFGALGRRGVIRDVGLVDVTVNILARTQNTGGLAGVSYGTIAASYVVGGTVHGQWVAGGLVGRMIGNAEVIASYAAVDVTIRDNAVGGLVGSMNDMSVVNASYAVGLVNGIGRVGGLIGERNGSAARIEASYYDRERSNLSSCCGHNPPIPDNTSKTSGELRAPIMADGIYTGWDNLNVDGIPGGIISPWDFGNSFQYPVLRGTGTCFAPCNPAAFRAQRQRQPPALVTLSQRTFGALAEGSTGQFTIALGGRTVEPVLMNWAVELTGNGPHHAAAADFPGRRLPTGFVTIRITDSAVIEVPIARDETSERVEYFRVRLSDLRDPFSMDRAPPDNLRLSVASSSVVSAIASNGTDYDADGNNLIEVRTSTQLSTIRYDLQGRGLRGVDLADAITYERAFPFFDVEATCSDGCDGYELVNDLDLSEVRPVRPWGWTPIGGGERRSLIPGTNFLPEEHRYNAVFEGNGYVISNMRVLPSNPFHNQNAVWHHVGLFRALHRDGVIRNVGLTNVNVFVHRNSLFTGGLAGANYGGKVAASYVVGGSVRGGWSAGGLVGNNPGTIIAGYSDVFVRIGSNAAGGVAGSVGEDGKVIASYSLGRVGITSLFNVGGDIPLQTGALVGVNGAASTATAIESSYFDRNRSGTSFGGVNVPLSAVRASGELRAPIAADGIYTGWDNLNVDGVDQSSDGDLNDDSPWHFGNSFQYPVLRGISARFPGGNTTGIRAQRGVQQRSYPPVLVTLSQRSVGSLAEGSMGQFTIRLGNRTVDPVSVRWVVETTGRGQDHAAPADFSGGRLATGWVTIRNSDSADFTVPIIQDGMPERAEQFRVRLSNLADPVNQMALDDLRLDAARSDVVSFIASHGTNYDTDGNNLIDVRTSTQLSAIRYDLGGEGLVGVAANNRDEYYEAFPFFDELETCPDGCDGYELVNDLDLSGVNPAPGLGWTPIGGGERRSLAAGNVLPEEHRYNAIFEGNGYVISNMRVRPLGPATDANSVWHHVGLFRALHREGAIRNVGMRDVDVFVHRDSIRAGGLAGANYGGKVAASYVVGGTMIGGRAVGGLVGANLGTIVAGYSNVGVQIGSDAGGGVAGSVAGNEGKVIASYSLGQVGLAANRGSTGLVFGGLVGRNETASTAIVASYFNTESSGISSGGRDVPSTAAQTTRALQSPVAADGIYAGWDGLNVDDTSSTVMGSVLTRNDDNPWDFGTNRDYPVLRGVSARYPDGNTTGIRAQRPEAADISVGLVRKGAATRPEGATAEYDVTLSAYGAEVRVDWSVEFTGVGDGHADASDFETTRGEVVLISTDIASFRITIQEDDAPEPRETFRVRLSNPRGLLGLRLGAVHSFVDAIAGSSGTDYDADDDGLIDVATTSQLAVIRHDLGGLGLMGVSGAANRTAYRDAFENFDQARTCPVRCAGYELLNDLDLSSIPNWTPIGGGLTQAPWDIPLNRRYNAVFEGNGYVVSNMTILSGNNAADRFDAVGFFGAVGAAGRIRNLGLRNVHTNLAGRSIGAGALAGYSAGRIAACYVVDSSRVVRGGWSVGGLVGRLDGGTVIASYTDVPVHQWAPGQSVGGLIGGIGNAGIVSASYSLSRLTRNGNGLAGSPSGGLVGDHSSGTIQISYFDERRSGQSACCGNNRPDPDAAPRTSSQLSTPTAAEGIYAGWGQLNVNDADENNDGNRNDDSPWHFGTWFDYPVLVFGGATETESARRASQQQTQPAVSFAPTLAGSETVAEGASASYVVSLPGALPAGARARWDWSVGGGDVDAGDFVDTNGSVTIASGEVSASFSVAVFDDDVPELAEVLVVTLRNARLTGAPARVRLGVPGSVRTTIELSDGTDYDGDGDTLIEVATTSQLAVIRHDLGGAGIAGVGSANRADYYAAFPFFDHGRTCSGACTGYELSSDLDLSSIPDWTPLGGGSDSLSGRYYTAVFEGNGYVIGNLRVNRAGRLSHAGLFGAVGAGGTVRNVGLRNAQITVGSQSTYTGALVGRNEGTVAASYVQGGRIAGVWSVGGLIGGNFDRLVASYADVEVHAGGANAGGLIGWAGAASVVSASYSTGETTGAEAVGGLIGNRVAGAVLDSSYFDGERSGRSHCCGVNPPSPDNSSKTSNELHAPTTAVGTIYAGWDRLDVDGVDQGRDLDFNDDSPWDFGTWLDYPVLVFGGAAETESARRASQRQAQPAASLVPTLAGSETVAEGDGANYVVSLERALPAGVTASWSWAVGGGMVGADDFAGTSRGRVAIAPGRSSASFSLAVAADGVAEFAEVFEVSLDDATVEGIANVRLGVPAAAVQTTITANFRRVTVAAPATVAEGATATFTLRSSSGGDHAVVVEYEISAVSADLTPEDLSAVRAVGRAGASVRAVVSLPATGSVTLDETGMATIEVGVANDRAQDENRENFRLRLTGCANCRTEYPARLGTPSFADVVIRREKIALTVDARVYLQGALPAASRAMRTDLARLLPSRQPYGSLPWRYPVATTVPHAGATAGLAGVTQTVVDWVLVELRTGADAAAAASSQPATDTRAAGLLLSDGRIAGLDQAAASLADALSLDGVGFVAELPAGEDVYVLIHHRNHLSVMSALPAAATGAACTVDYCVDFRVGQAHADGQIEVRTGVYAMVAGDVDQNGAIDAQDEALIGVYNLTSLGAADYRDPDEAGHYAVDADLDFDREVLSIDRYFVIENQGRRRAFSVGPRR